MNDLTGLPGAPFDLVLDVGGNLGQFAGLAVQAWPAAHVVSFEPIPELFDANVQRSAGRWVTLRENRRASRTAAPARPARTREPVNAAPCLVRRGAGCDACS